MSNSATTNNSTSGIKNIIMSPTAIAIAKTTVGALAAWGAQDLFRRGYASYMIAKEKKALGAPSPTAHPTQQQVPQARA